jgi:hypothetical protein
MASVFNSQTEGLGGSGMMDEKLLTNLRVLFVEFAFQLGSFLLNVRATGMQQQH